MEITVKAYSVADDAKRFPPDGKMKVPDGSKICDVMVLLSLPPELEKSLLLFVNGRPKGLDHVLKSGDAVVVFPPFEGG